MGFITKLMFWFLLLVIGFFAGAMMVGSVEAFYFNDTFNNSLDTEDLQYTSSSNITRWLSIPENVFLTQAFLNFSSINSTVTGGEVLYWSFNTTALNVTDEINGVNNLTRSLEASFVPGILGNAVNFNADTSGSYLDTNLIDKEALNITNGSISLWFNWTSKDLLGEGIHTIFSINSNSVGSREITISLDDRDSSPDFIQVAIRDGGGTDWTLTSAGESLDNITQSEWHHLVLLKHGSYAQLYLDGQNMTGQIKSPGSNEFAFLSDFANAGLMDILSVGTSRDGGGTASVMNGSVDELIIYDRLLTPLEITNLYNNRNGLEYTAESPNNIANITLEIGNEDGSFEWEFGGIFSQTNNKTSNLFTAINNYISSCNIINGVCLVPFIFGSDGSGVLRYLDLFFLNDGFTENSQTFNNDTVSLSTEEYLINMSYDSGRYNSITATLVYNNTDVTSSTSDIGDNKVFTSSLSIPTVINQTNISFYWEVELIESGVSSFYNSTFNNQSVTNFLIDDCSVHSDLILNYTLKDEGTTNNILIAENTSIEIEAIISSTSDPSNTISFSQTYNNTLPAQVCLGAGVLGNGTWSMDVQTRYSAGNYVTEFQNIQNASLNAINFPQNIDLFPLLTANSQEFVITFKDDSFAPVEDALMTITRKYVGEGLFRTVEAPLTDVDGQALTHLVIGDVVYTIIVTKNGKLLGTFDNVKAFCDDSVIGDCKINLDAFSTGIAPTDYETVNDLSYTMDFDKPTRTITVIYSVTSGAVSTLVLNGTLFDSRGNSSVCSDELTSSSGTLTCLIPSAYGNASVLAVLIKDGSIINSAVYNLKQTADDIFGGTGVIFLLMLYMTLPLMLVTSGPFMIIGAIVGLVAGALLNIFTTNNIMGVGSTILWFVIAGSIIIWKTSKREQ